MIYEIKPPIHYPPLDLNRCTKQPFWCKKEIAKRLILLLLEWTRSRALPFITHIQPAGPGPPRAPVIPSPSEAIFTILSNTTDGHIGRTGGTWDQCRNATDGTGYNDASTDYVWAARAAFVVGIRRVTRSFFDFDLSSISSSLTVTAVTLKIRKTGSRSDVISIQQGTQNISISTADFDQFTGLFFATQSWTDTFNTFTFNAAGIAYIQSVLGSTAKLCAREYDHDYLDVEPGIGITYAGGMYYADTPLDDDKPLLTITTG